MFQQQISPWSIYDNFGEKGGKVEKQMRDQKAKEERKEKQLVRSKDITEILANINEEKKDLVQLIDKLAMLKLIKNELFENQNSKNPLSLPLPSIHAKNADLVIHRSGSLDEYKPKGKGKQNEKKGVKVKYHYHHSQQLYNIGHEDNLQHFSSIFPDAKIQNPQETEQRNLPQFPKIQKSQSILLPQLQSKNDQFSDQNIYDTLESAKYAKRSSNFVDNYPVARRRNKLSTLVYDYPV